MRCGRTEAAQGGHQGSSFLVVIDREDLLAHGELTKSRNHSLTQVMIESLHTFPADPLSNCWCSSHQQMTAEVHFYCAYGWGVRVEDRGQAVFLSLHLILLYKMCCCCCCYFVHPNLYFPSLLSPYSPILVFLLPISSSSISLQNRAGLPWIPTKHGILKSY